MTSGDQGAAVPTSAGLLQAIWLGPGLKRALLVLVVMMACAFMGMLFFQLKGSITEGSQTKPPPELRPQIWPDDLAMVRGPLTAEAVSADKIRWQVLYDLESNRTNYIAEQSTQAVYRSQVAHYQAVQALHLRSLENDLLMRQSSIIKQHEMKGPLLLVVIAIVFCGLGMSFMQFFFASNIPLVPGRPSSLPPQAEAEPPTAALAQHPMYTELDLSATTGLKIKTQALGLAVLGMSLGFFYLFLVHVYAIQPEKVLAEGTVPEHVAEKKDTADVKAP